MRRVRYEAMASLLLAGRSASLLTSFPAAVVRGSRRSSSSSSTSRNIHVLRFLQATSTQSPNHRGGGSSSSNSNNAWRGFPRLAVLGREQEETRRFSAMAVTTLAGQNIAGRGNVQSHLSGKADDLDGSETSERTRKPRHEPSSSNSSTSNSSRPAASRPPGTGAARSSAESRAAWAAGAAARVRGRGTGQTSPFGAAAAAGRGSARGEKRGRGWGCVCSMHRARARDARECVRFMISYAARGGDKLCFVNGLVALL